MHGAWSSAWCSCVTGPLSLSWYSCIWSSVWCSCVCGTWSSAWCYCISASEDSSAPVWPLMKEHQENCSNFHRRRQSTSIRLQPFLIRTRTPLPGHQDSVLSPNTSPSMLRESAAKSSLPGSVLLQDRYPHAGVDRLGGLRVFCSALLPRFISLLSVK